MDQINDKSFHKYLNRIEKIGEIQEKLVSMGMDASQEDIDQIFQSIPKEFFISKTKFDNFLQAIISILFGGSKRERMILLILERLKDYIGHFFKNDDVHLIKIVEPYIFVNEWFLENNFLSIDTIVKESQYDLKLSQYFLPEIIENKPSLFFDYLLIKYQNEYSKDFFLTVQTKGYDSFSKNELEEIKNRRKNQIKMFFGQNRDFESYYTYDPNALRCTIMSDDIDRFQNILSKNNISINSVCPPSIYDPSFFPNQNINYEKRTLIEAAALFGSVKIFKFLLLNNAELRPKEIFRRVLFGRNFDIFHMVEKHIMRNAVLTKIKKKKYKSSKDPKTQSYVDLYMNNDFDPADIFGNKTNSDNESNAHNTNDINFSNSDDDFIKNIDNNYDDDNDNKDEKLDNESNDDEYIWVLDKKERSNRKIKEYFSNCMMYSIKYGFDEISDYLYDNYETTFDFEINTNIISEREVNFCLQNFKQKLLPFFMRYPNDGDEFENTYLMNATYFNYTDIVKLLLKIPGIDVNIINSLNKSTALSRATDQHSYKTVEILLKSPLFKYTFDENYFVTPFAKAASHGYVDIMMLLINTKKNNKDDERFKDLLNESDLKISFSCALSANQSESIKIILDNFPNINFFDDGFLSSIKQCSRRKNWDSLLCLLDEINEKRELYEQLFDSVDFAEILNEIKKYLEDKLDENDE